MSNTNIEILQKVIEKAVKNGWDMFDFKPTLRSWNVVEQEYSHQSWLYARTIDEFIYPLKVSLNDVIFDPDFAKAFWGEEMCNQSTRQKAFGRYWFAWQYHLQQLAIAEDRIKYLEQFI